MKHIITAVLLFIPVVSFGAFTGQGSAQTTTAAQALKASDDTPVILEGSITKRIKGDKYLFADNSGTITVEIDDDIWRGVNVSETDTVRLYGEADTSAFKQTKIDVDRVEHIK